MTILLSGSTGFLGSYLLKSFINKGFNVIAIKRSSSNLSRVNDVLDQCIVYDSDIVELNTIFETHHIDIVINTVTNYGRSNKQISSIVETNLLFGLKLLEESVNHNVQAFINTDTLLDRNLNAYALSKGQLVDWMHFLSHHNTKMITIKIEHMYGPLDDENKFIYWVINQLKQNVKKIDLTLGTQKRDFIYIDDIVSAYETIIQNISTLSSFEAFELGSGHSIEVKVFIERIYSELSQQHSIDTLLNFGAIPYRDNENMCMAADISKLQELGWNPTIFIEDGIRKITNGED